MVITFRNLCRTLFLVICTFSCVLASTVHAVTNDFTVQTLVGDDVTPPSIPANVTATPVATTQIDLSWDASTDDYLLSGYYVWRDDVQVATTTLTTYSDTGLTSSTTYTYYVVAYDAFANISASSSLVSTTTLSPAPPAATTTPTASGTTQYGSRLRPLAEEIISVEVIPQQNSALIRYITDNHTKTAITWGKTSSYEIGSLAEQSFLTTHERTITDLTPRTTYQFFISGENKIGKTGGMYSGSFTTLPPDDVFPPENVSLLTADIDGDDVLLTWENPHDPDFSYVRVVRNDRFYPNDIADGWVVYEGADTSLRDSGVIEEGVRQYYSVFAYDELGNISSGAVVSVYKKKSTTGGEVEEELPEEEIIIDPEKNEITLKLQDVQFMQEGILLTQHEGKITIDGSKQLTVTVPYDLVPEHLKTILVTLKDSRNHDRVFTFLLRINKDKTGYTGTLASFGVSSEFPIQISVFDYTTAQIGYADGVLISHITPITSESEVEGVVGGIVRLFTSWNTYLVLWSILLLILLMYFGRRVMHRKY